MLLIRDKNNPDFKMMVVADGMGGHKSGEIASNEIVERLKDWFLNLSDEQKACYETSVENLKNEVFGILPNGLLIQRVKDKVSAKLVFVMQSINCSNITENRMKSDITGTVLMNMLWIF